jgi:hypothetical protein
VGSKYSTFSAFAKTDTFSNFFKTIREDNKKEKYIFLLVLGKKEEDLPDFYKQKGVEKSETEAEEDKR